VALSFNADEILQMAEQIERNGAKFYRRAAGSAAKGAEKILLDLAAREEEHEKTFAAMRAGLSDGERKAPLFQKTDDAAAYLQAWADGHVFDVRRDPTAGLTGKETIQQILMMAIGMEKDSIVFYLGMKEAVPEKQGRAAVDKIIKEEMGHMALLSRQLGSSRHQAL